MTGGYDPGRIIQRAGRNDDDGSGLRLMPKAGAAGSAAHHIALTPRFGGAAVALHLTGEMLERVAWRSDDQEIGATRHLFAGIAVAGIHGLGPMVQPPAHGAAETAAGIRRLGNGRAFNHWAPLAKPSQQ